MQDEADDILILADRNNDPGIESFTGNALEYHDMHNLVTTPTLLNKTMKGSLNDICFTNYWTSIVGWVITTILFVL